MTKEEYIQQINAIWGKAYNEIILTTDEYLYKHISDRDVEIKNNEICLEKQPLTNCVRLQTIVTIKYDFDLDDLSMLRPEVFQHREEDITL